VPDRPEKLVSNFDRESVDDFDTTGDDLYQVVVEIADLFNYLEGQPLEDPLSMVDLLTTPTYPYRDQILRDFTELTANGWRYADPGIETVGIEVLSVDGDQAVVIVADRRGDQVLVDSGGQVAMLYRGWDLDKATFTFERGTDRRWRYADVGEFTPASEEDLASMVPVDWTGRSA
jgi:hypothetical protein